MGKTAIIMVAGRGTRLRTFTDKPKSTLLINNKPIIRRTVELLLSRKIKVALAIGYQSEYIKAALDGCDVSYFYNPFFDITNSIVSLWFAREFLDGDVLLFNGDVWFEEKLLDDLLTQKENAVMLCDKSRTEIGDYFFKTDKNGVLQKFGKDLPVNERSAEYVGFAKISKEFLPQFKEKLETMINNQEHHCWWENVLYSFVPEKPIYTLDTNGKFWGEVDTVDDYHKIVKYAKKEGKK